MICRFIVEWNKNEQQFIRRLVVQLPIEPCIDPFARMTANQMAAFEAKLSELKEALVYVAYPSRSGAHALGGRLGGLAAAASRRSLHRAAVLPDCWYR